MRTNIYSTSYSLFTIKKFYLFSAFTFILRVWKRLWAQYLTSPKYKLSTIKSFSPFPDRNHSYLKIPLRFFLTLSRAVIKLLSYLFTTQHKSYVRILETCQSEDAHLWLAENDRQKHSLQNQNCGYLLQIHEAGQPSIFSGNIFQWVNLRRNKMDNTLLRLIINKYIIAGHSEHCLYK